MLSATANVGLMKKAIRASNAFLNETRIRISEEGVAIRLLMLATSALLISSFQKRISKRSELKKELSA